MAETGLVSSFLAAIQASSSVLLVILYGALAARFKLLDSGTGKVLSKICVRMFLPALLFTKIGSELHAESATRYGIIFLWALICHFISFLIGAGAHLFLGMPDWITVAIMFNNTTSYPLLLIEALDETGILSSLIITNESSRDAIERAKSYFLVFATVSSCLTFAVGPRLIDSEHAPEPDDDKVVDGDDETLADPQEHDVESNENTSLLQVPPQPYHRGSVASVSFFPSTREYEPIPSDRRPSLLPKSRWNKLSPRTQWWLLFAFDFLNAPLLGAVAGAVVGLIPVLHRAFFSDTRDGGIFTAWLTASFKTIGSLFVPLPVVIAGVSLYTSYMDARRQGASSSNSASELPWHVALFIIFIRFLVWPVASIGIIYGLANRTSILGDDPMLWFTMMLMPTGPSAMKLITMVAVSNATEEDEHIIAKLLTLSYIISPILAFTVVGSLRASQSIIY
ncbi:hypothetical protein BT63DRAFT_422117 [Microthyrium microscopicum]|uniref:Auxin efflux carrier n=1 Tax=Microthyrium microscopicum TaxID=703497 RepID=A0A6A6UIG0_9PEZI|nr:hypothetical protein BT63DRAFT_422117 [Microthyrium microscopicum]